MSSSKKFTCKGTLRKVFICLRPHPLLDFCLGWCSNCAGSESGQIQSVNYCRICCPAQLSTPPPHPLPATQCLIYYTLTQGWEGGGGGVPFQVNFYIFFLWPVNFVLVNPRVPYANSTVQFCTSSEESQQCNTTKIPETVQNPQISNRIRKRPYSWWEGVWEENKKFSETVPLE